MPSPLTKLDKILESIESYVIGYATIAMAAVLFINVVMRNFFHSGLVWGNELSSYLNILAVYFAVSAGFRHGSHVGVSAFVHFVIPKALRGAAAALTHLLSLAFCVAVIIFAARMSSAQLSLGQASPVMGFPLGVVYGVVVLGMVLSCIRLAMEIVKLVYAKNRLSQGGDATC